MCRSYLTVGIRKSFPHFIVWKPAKGHTTPTTIRVDFNLTKYQNSLGILYEKFQW